MMTEKEFNDLLANYPLEVHDLLASGYALIYNKSDELGELYTPVEDSRPFKFNEKTQFTGFICGWQARDLDYLSGRVDV